MVDNGQLGFTLKNLIRCWCCTDVGVEPEIMALIQMSNLGIKSFVDSIGQAGKMAFQLVIMASLVSQRKS